MTFNPTPEAVEAAYQAWLSSPRCRGAQNTKNAISAALVAAAGAAPQEPKDDFLTPGNHAASVQVDEAKLAAVERAAAEEAWDACVSDFQQAHGIDSTEPWPYLRDNPYRRNEGEK